LALEAEYSAAVADDLNEGDVVAGRYRLDHLLGEGGMGSVWAATHLVTRRSLAVKFLLGPLTARADMRERFLREARAAVAVDHPNVVEIFDVFELDDGTPVMVMALLKGETLEARLERERTLPLESVAEIMLPVVSAVGTAHSRGIVHRDLKPDNVFLASEGTGAVVKVLDFGIAKLVLHEEPTQSGKPVTAAGTMLGTLCYMSPEQLFGERDVDHRADVWAIGVMLYQALAGVLPIEGEHVGQVMKNLMTNAITPVESLAPSLPSDVSSLIMRMLAREREGRPADLREVFESLSRYTAVSAPSFGSPNFAAPSVPPAETSGVPSRQRGASPAATARSGGKGVDPAARTVAAEKAGATGAHAISVVDVRTRNRTVMGLVVGAILIAVIAWRVGRSTQPTVTTANPVPQAPSNATTAPAVPAPTEHTETTRPEAPPNPTTSSAATSSAPASSVPAPSAQPPALAKDGRKTHPRSQASSGPTKRTSEATPTPTPTAAEGLHEDVPF
jgi:eukaryotic-like serine/threonine-protein kinase